MFVQEFFLVTCAYLLPGVNTICQSYTKNDMQVISGV